MTQSRIQSRIQSRRLSLRLGAAMVALCGAGQALAQSDDTTTIKVTATRRSVDVSKVPINITAYTQKLMDVRSIRNIDDLANLTPDLLFTRTSGVAGNNATNIAIRGIESEAGSATTAIYIDDTPLEMRNTGYWNTNIYPKIFDLDRVEVLRGPQGTLFGASSEGGAVRFITPVPDLEKTVAYMKTDLSGTVGGTPSYEAGVVYGAPLVKDKLAFRIAAWGRNDGGYINRVNPFTDAVLSKDDNWEHSGSLKLDVTYKPYDNLTITPTLFLQDVYDHGRDQYWNIYSNPASDKFNNGSWSAEPSNDAFTLPALKVQYDLDGVSLFSNTSYLSRRLTQTLDYTTYLNSIFSGNPLNYQPGDQPSDSYLDTHQTSFTQEARVQSNDKDALIDWTVGFFFTRDKEQEDNLTSDGIYADRDTGLIDGRYSFITHDADIGQQIAGYANADLNVTAKLKISAGVRVEQASYKYTDLSTGPLVGGTSVSSGHESEVPVTPRFSVSYQLNPRNFFYATVAKGYRPGGSQAPITISACDADLAAIGLTQGPAKYNSDHLWSYEAGSKNSLFDGRLHLDGSGYYIKWSNIQESVRLADCGFSFIDNLGSATSKGGDLTATVAWTDAISTGTSVGYADTTYDKNYLAGQGAILVSKGEAIGGPPLNASLWAQYKFVAYGYDSYYRIDDAFHSRAPTQNPADVYYDPEILPTKANDYVSMRVGAQFGMWDASLYADNVTNNSTTLSMAHDIPGVKLFYESTYRPLTIGITAERKF